MALSERSDGWRNLGRVVVELYPLNLAHHASRVHMHDLRALHAKSP